MYSLKTGRSSFFPEFLKHGPAIKNIIFVDLDQTSSLLSINPGRFRLLQLKALYGTVPLFALSHIYLTVTLSILILAHVPNVVAGLWFGLSVLPMLLTYIVWRFRYQDIPDEADLACIRWTELLGAAFGVAWAMCPLLLLAASPMAMQILIIGYTMAATAVGAFAFARVPSAAIIFSGLVTCTLGASLATFDQPVGIAFAILMLAFEFVLGGLILNFHRDQLQIAVDAQDLQSQNEIIGLLLNDFEEGTKDWLWGCDAQGILTYLSQSFSKAVGKSQDELLQMTLFEAAGASAAASGWREIEEKMRAHDLIVNCHAEIWIGNRETHWMISAKPLSDGYKDFIGYRGVARDITEKWDFEQKLIDAKETAEAASAAKSSFLAVMSHELRTPLNSIVGFSEILSQRNDDATSIETRIDYARTILESSRHLQTLINDIIDATRIENKSIRLAEQEIDCAELIEIAVKMCRDQAQKADVTLVARLSDGIELRADITRSKQVILNLLVNAIKFSHAGGVVNVDVIRTPGDALVIAIQDDGIGVAQGDLYRIFEPFVQVEHSSARRFSGIGLGLSIARKIARLHGGDVTLESRVGAGTTAKFILPRQRVTWPKHKAIQGHQDEAVAAR